MQPEKMNFNDLCDIPEVAALSTEQMRRFVWVYAQNGCDAKNAAAEVGYSPHHGWVLKQRDDIRAAIRAIATRFMDESVLLANRVAVEIMSDPTVEPGARLKAAFGLLDRNGFGPQSKQHITVEKVPDEAEMIQLAIEWAQRRGIDPAQVIGQNTPQLEARKVAEDTFDISDIMGPSNDE